MTDGILRLYAGLLSLPTALSDAHAFGISEGPTP